MTMTKKEMKEITMNLAVKSVESRFDKYAKLENKNKINGTSFIDKEVMLDSILTSIEGVLSPEGLLYIICTMRFPNGYEMDYKLGRYDLENNYGMMIDSKGNKKEYEKLHYFQKAIEKVYNTKIEKELICSDVFNMKTVKEEYELYKKATTFNAKNTMNKLDAGDTKTLIEILNAINDEDYIEEYDCYMDDFTRTFTENYRFSKNSIQMKFTKKLFDSSMNAIRGLILDHMYKKEINMELLSAITYYTSLCDVNLKMDIRDNMILDMLNICYSDEKINIEDLNYDDEEFIEVGKEYNMFFDIDFNGDIKYINLLEQLEGQVALYEIKINDIKEEEEVEVMENKYVEKKIYGMYVLETDLVKTPNGKYGEIKEFKKNNRKVYMLVDDGNKKWRIEEYLTQTVEIKRLVEETKEIVVATNEEIDKILESVEKEPETKKILKCKSDIKAYRRNENCQVDYRDFIEFKEGDIIKEYYTKNTGNYFIQVNGVEYLLGFKSYFEVLEDETIIEKKVKQNKPEVKVGIKCKKDIKAYKYITNDILDYQNDYIEFKKDDIIEEFTVKNEREYVKDIVINGIKEHYNLGHMSYFEKVELEEKKVESIVLIDKVGCKLTTEFVSDSLNQIKNKKDIGLKGEITITHSNMDKIYLKTKEEEFVFKTWDVCDVENNKIKYDWTCFKQIINDKGTGVVEIAKGSTLVDKLITLNKEKLILKGKDFEVIVPSLDINYFDYKEDDYQFENAKAEKLNYLVNDCNVDLLKIDEFDISVETLDVFTTLVRCPELTKKIASEEEICEFDKCVEVEGNLPILRSCSFNEKIKKILGKEKNRCISIDNEYILVELEEDNTWSIQFKNNHGIYCIIPEKVSYTEYIPYKIFNAINNIIELDEEKEEIYLDYLSEKIINLEELEVKEYFLKKQMIISDIILDKSFIKFFKLRMCNLLQQNVDLGIYYGTPIDVFDSYGEEKLKYLMKKKHESALIKILTTEKDSELLEVNYKNKVDNIFLKALDENVSLKEKIELLLNIKFNIMQPVLINKNNLMIDFNKKIVYSFKCKDGCTLTLTFTKFNVPEKMKN